MKEEERLKKEKQDMLGFYDYTVVLTYISLVISVFGMTRALAGDFKVAILCLALSGLCDMFDGKIARTKKDRTEDEKKFVIQNKIVGQQMKRILEQHLPPLLNIFSEDLRVLHPSAGNKPHT